MLYEVTLQNFKPFGDPQTARLSKITLVCGPNSGGKSSLIQALMLMRQSIEDHRQLRGFNLIPRGEYVDLGSFSSLLHKHELKRELSVALEYDMPQVGRPLSGVPPSSLSRRITTQFRAAASPGSRVKDTSELASVRYELKGDPPLDVSLNKVAPSVEDPMVLPDVGISAPYAWADATSAVSFARYLIKLAGRNKVPSEPALRDVLARTRILAVSGLPSRISFDGEIGDRSSFVLLRPLEGIASEYYQILRSLSYLGPLRSHPARHYMIMGGEMETVGIRGENAPQMIYRRRQQIEKEINAWFKAFEIPYSLKVKQVGDEVTGEIIAMTLTDRRTDVAVAPSDVGFGIGQLLPILVEGVVAEGRILCVEQPEIHLHPRLQAHVADLLIKTAGLRPLSERGQQSSRIGNQWIVETHSEALILRLQRRIREKKISHEDISVLYIEPGDKAGSRILHLRLDEDGEFIDEWPGGFFEEGYKEIFGGQDE